MAMLLCLSVSALTSQAQTADRLHINEIMVANIDRFWDTSWNFGSWVEIFNSSSTDINLNRYHINTGNDNRGRIRIGYDLVIPAHGYGVLWFGHRYWKAPTQTDAELDNDGGYFTLFSPGGNVLDRVAYPPSVSRCSWARCTDGAGEWTYTSFPTPGSSNGSLPLTQWRMPAPDVDTDSRFFSAILKVRVNIPDGATLIYTTDGSVPSRTNGEVSTSGLFRMTASRVFRFILVRDGYLDSPVVTRSYIRKEHIINMPMVSVVTDPAHLYDEMTGFFVQGTNGRAGKGADVPCNWNMDWDRPVNVEYITQDNVCRLNQEVWMSRCGGHSKGFTPMSFKIHASKDFDGENTLDCAFFADKPYVRHKALQFRNGGNDNECRIWDAALQSLVRTSGIDMDLQDYRPVAHYINGRFMGTINMREPNNKHNVYANHGLSADEIDMFEIDCDSGYVQMCGTRDAWEELLELSAAATDDDTYRRILDRIDVDEFCNYMAVQFYLGNADWPQNNCKGWRPREENGRFRFVLYDLDLTFCTNSPLSHFNGVSYYTFCQLYDVPGVSNYTREVELVRLFGNLCKRPDFAHRFADAFSLVGGSVFRPDRCEQLISKYAQEAEDVQLLESGYPGRNVSPWPSARRLISILNGWAQKVSPSLQAYMPSLLAGRVMREVSFSANIPQACLLMNGQQVPAGRFNGYAFLPVTLEAMAPDGYGFVGWRDVESGKILSENRTLELTGSVACGELEACFSKEYTGKPVVINEVSAGNSIYVNEYFRQKDWVEVYNPSPSAVDISGYFLSDDLHEPFKYRIEGPHTTIPAGGYKVIWCDGMSAEKYLHATFNLSDTDGAAVLLTAPDGAWQDTLVYCAHSGRETVGRFPDGGSPLYRFSRPTIEGGNAMSSYSVPAMNAEMADGVISPDTERTLPLRFCGEVYDLSGRRMSGLQSSKSNVQRGVYIVRGKKVLVN